MQLYLEILKKNKIKIMKKLILTNFCVLLIVSFFASCHKEDVTSKINPPQNIQRKCGSMDVLALQLKEDPNLAVRMQEIENFTSRAISQHLTDRLVNGVVEIPVVVNVLYRTSSENISDSQIQSQIDVLNEDYNAANSDFNLVPSTFSSVKANVGIRFVLDKIVRKATTKSSWSTNDYVKRSSKGGIDPTSPTTKLNMWSCTLSGGVLGYAQFPGGSSSTDGVVILNSAFGRSGTAASPFDKGRSATHEVGHWLNLRHIWGDATCGTDYVNDTPTHNDANFGCPATGHRSTCSGTPIEMTMNYMDYTDDACMYMFSNGQKSRMTATFLSGGGRSSFAQ